MKTLKLKLDFDSERLIEKELLVDEALYDQILANPQTFEDYLQGWFTLNWGSSFTDWLILFGTDQHRLCLSVSDLG